MIIHRKYIYIFIRENDITRSISWIAFPYPPRDKKLEMESANIMPVPVHNFASVLADVSTPTWTT